jgi:hypothetical protein
MARPVGTFGSEGRVDPDRCGEIVTLKVSGQRWCVVQTTQECYVLRPVDDGRGTLLLTPKEMEEHTAA